MSKLMLIITNDYKKGEKKEMTIKQIEELKQILERFTGKAITQVEEDKREVSFIHVDEVVGKCVKRTGKLFIMMED